MSNVPAHLLQQVQAAIDSNTEMDMTVATKGGGGRLYPEGYAFARLVSYIELGSHPVVFQGQTKDPSPQFQLGFLIWGEARNLDGSSAGFYHDPETNTPGFIRTYDISQSTNEKAKAFKLFKKLNYKGVYKTFGQMLGEGFLLKIVHTKSAKDPNAKPRANIDLDGFLPPLDAVSKQPYPIPEPKGDDYKLFLWNHPTKEMWDSLFVEGQYDDGNSKNYIQETICKAVNFPGSPLEQLLHGTTMPSLAAQGVPTVPSSQGLPAAPAVSQESVPSVPSGNTDTPPWEASSAPSIPAVPSAVGAGAVPSIPSGIPAVPSSVPVGVPAVDASGVPAVPSIPQVPTL